jgi:transposase InsO family protein
VVEATVWGRRPRHLVRDRDAVYGGDSAGRAEGPGIETVLTPVRAPRANAIAERVVRTLRNDCLDYLIPLDEAHLRVVLTEYVAYDNSGRPHRALALQPPLPRPPTSSGPIRRRPVRGGLHHVYERAA